MKPLSEPRAAVTKVMTTGGTPVPLEASPAVPDGPFFRVREAVTVRQGPRGGRIRVRTAGETPAPLDARPTEAEAPVATFQVREAVTTTLPPPHWAKLVQAAELKPVEVDAPAVAWEPPEAEAYPEPPEPPGATKDHRPEAYVTESVEED